METKERKAKADFNDSNIIDHKIHVLLADRDGEISLGEKCHGQVRKIEEYLNDLPKETLLWKK